MLREENGILIFEYDPNKINDYESLQRFVRKWSSFNAEVEEAGGRHLETFDINYEIIPNAEDIIISVTGNDSLYHQLDGIYTIPSKYEDFPDEVYDELGLDRTDYEVVSAELAKKRGPLFAGWMKAFRRQKNSHMEWLQSEEL